MAFPDPDAAKKEAAKTVPAKTVPVASAKSPVKPLEQAKEAPKPQAAKKQQQSESDNEGPSDTSSLMLSEQQDKQPEI